MQIRFVCNRLPSTSCLSQMTSFGSGDFATVEEGVALCGVGAANEPVAPNAAATTTIARNFIKSLPKITTIKGRMP
jgi:hypothetical protein